MSNGHARTSLRNQTATRRLENAPPKENQTATHRLESALPKDATVKKAALPRKLNPTNGSWWMVQVQPKRLSSTVVF